MTVATPPPVVTVTNVRTAAPELGPLVPLHDYYAYQRPNPNAPYDPRSQARVVIDDVDAAVRWLGFTGVVGTYLALSVPTWVWWTLVPWAVSIWHNHLLYVAQAGRHRARRRLCGSS